MSSKTLLEKSLDTYRRKPTETLKTVIDLLVDVEESYNDILNSHDADNVGYLIDTLTFCQHLLHAITSMYNQSK